jgi:hypothetical protein
LRFLWELIRINFRFNPDANYGVKPLVTTGSNLLFKV